MTIPEHNALIDNIDLLCHVIAQDLQDVGDKMLSRGILTEAQRSNLRLETNTHKAGVIVSAIVNKTAESGGAKHFDVFVEILKSMGVWTKDLVDSLLRSRDRYSKEVGVLILPYKIPMEEPFQLQSSKNITRRSHRPPVTTTSGPPRLSDIQKRTGATRENLDSVCTDKHLKHIAKELDNYKQYGKALGLKGYQLAAIETDKELTYLMRVLVTWKRNNVHTATYGVLAQKCLDLKKSDIATTICTLSTEPTQESESDYKQLPSDSQPRVSAHLRKVTGIHRQTADILTSKQPYVQALFGKIFLLVIFVVSLIAFITFTVKMVVRMEQLYSASEYQHIGPRLSHLDIDSEVVGKNIFVITNSATTMEWIGHGFRIHVPADALPADIHSCVLHIHASISGHYKFPANQELVSAVYWVNVDPPCRQFKRPLIIDIQHCAAKNSTEKLRFVIAPTSQKKPPYRFRTFKSHSFTDQSSYGSLELTHFSGFAVTKIVGNDREMKLKQEVISTSNRLYAAHILYRPKTDHKVDIFLTVTWDTDVHITAIYKLCKKWRTEIGSFLREMELKQEVISLQLPSESIHTESGYKLEPLARPVLTKTKVDSLEPGQEPRCFQLSAKYVKEPPIPDLEYRLTMNGVAEPNNWLKIDVNPSDLLRRIDALHSSSPAEPQIPPLDLEKKMITLVHPNEEPRMIQLLYFKVNIDNKPAAINIAESIGTSFRIFGVCLFDDHKKIDNFEHDCARKSVCIVEKLLGEWLEGKGREPISWSTLVDCLEVSKLFALAEDIKRQYTSSKEEKEL